MMSSKKKSLEITKIISGPLAHMAAACLFVPQAAPQVCKSSSIWQVLPENEAEDADVFSGTSSPNLVYLNVKNSPVWHASTIHQMRVLKECQTVQQLTSKSRQLCLSHCISLNLSSRAPSTPTTFVRSGVYTCGFADVWCITFWCVLSLFKHWFWWQSESEESESSKLQDMEKWSTLLHRPRTGPVRPRSWVVIPWRVKIVKLIRSTPFTFHPRHQLIVWALALTSCISVQAGYDEKKEWHTEIAKQSRLKVKIYH